MTPRLPTELLVEILTFAQYKSTPLTQRKLRNAFRLVCRDWYASFNRWNTIAIDGVSDLTNAVDQAVAASKAVKAADAVAGVGIKKCFRLVRSPGPGQWDGREAREVNRLLKVGEGMRALELELAGGVLSTGMDNSLSGVAPRRVVRLTALRSLTLAGASGSLPLILTTDAISTFARQCPALVTLCLKQIVILKPVDRSTSSLLSDVTTIRTVVLRSLRYHPPSRTAFCFPYIVAPIKQLIVRDDNLFASLAQHQDRLARRIIVHMRLLQNLTLMDQSSSNQLPALVPQTPSIRLGLAIEQLVSLRSLDISPVVTNDLAQTLAPLVKLERLTIVQGRAVSTAGLPAAAMLAVLESSLTLKRVVVSRFLVEAWSQQEQEKVAKAAARKQIVFVGL